MLFLNEANIKQAMSMQDAIDAIDYAYEIYADNTFNMPTRLQVVENDNTLLLMPCLIDDAVATKLVTVFPKNRERQQPTIYGLVILNDQETGEVKAILDGAFLTGFRTGAVGGSAIRHLATKQSESLAVVGTGVQGLYQTIAACTERPIKNIYAYNRTPEKVDKYKADLKNWLDPAISVHHMSSATDAIEQADIVITSTTSLDPVLPNNPSLLTNKLFVAIGSFQPNMRELPAAAFELSDRIFIDTHDAITESGDLVAPLENKWITREQIQPIASIIKNQQTITRHKNQTTIFKSTGMALFDAVVANEIYKKAMTNGIGQHINL